MEKDFGKDFRMDAERMAGLLDRHDFKQLKEELESVHPVDIVDAFEELDKKQRTLVFRLLAKEEAAEVFTDMNSDMREDLINALTDSELEEVMDRDVCRRYSGRPGGNACQCCRPSPDGDGRRYTTEDQCPSPVS